MTAKDLKNALLQEAVQGKLVPQIASEGNARDLLEEIRKAKEGGESLPLSSARKRSSATPSAGTPRNAPISEDEIPFDIPESWCWCRVGDIFNLQAGKNISSSEISETSNGKDYLCYGGNGIRGYVNKYNREGYYPLIGRQGALCGNVNFAHGKFYATEHAVVVETFANTDVKWAGLFLRALNLNQYATATAQPGLAVRNINEVYIPLPPLAEQKRIVAAIEKFMPLIEEYGKKETVLNQLNVEIGTLTKKAILQEAVQGKLVPQDSSEGNAKDLLKEIKAQKEALIKEGKIKKEKPLPEITEDEIPFDIPENWCYITPTDIGYFLSGQTPKPSELDSIGEIPYFKVSDMNTDGNELYMNTVKNYLKQNTKYRLIPAKSIIYPKNGGAVFTNKKRILQKDSLVDLNTGAFVPFSGINLDFFYFLFSTIDFTQYYKGTALPTVDTDAVKKIVWGLPPLSEQKCIVAAIEQLLPLCEKLGK